MSRPPGSTSSGDVARGAGFAAAKGMLLIGLAVVIGIVLLQQVDDDKGTNVGAAPTTTSPPRATTTVPPAPATTAPPPPAAPAKTAAELRVIVLNGGAPSGEAGRLSTRLKQQGYTNQPQDANNWSGRSQQGNSLLCKTGLQRETVTLAGVLGQGTEIEPYPADPPSVIEAEVDCIVVVGA
jgi:hypothetical protein